MRLWDKQFAAVNLPRKLSLLYLCNAIMQKARKKVGTNYANEFFKILPGALRHVRKHSDAAGAAKLDRLGGVWGERGVYSASAIQTIRKVSTDLCPLTFPSVVTSVLLEHSLGLSLLGGCCSLLRNPVGDCRRSSAAHCRGQACGLEGAGDRGTDVQQ